jgi:Raf kinase inhibitor-like YbhB/YbcL family protein
VVTLFDEDEHGTPSGWWHWILFNIPGSATGLARGAGTAHASSLPAGAIHGRSDDGSEAYAGPCPEVGDPAHRYLFTVYALSVDKLPVAAGSSGAMVTYSVHEYTLAKATLIARHRNTAPH